MAEQASFPKERLEDVFQEEIIKKFADIASFKKFARSKDGLCLDQSHIKTIVEDHKRNVEEQKLEMLFKWREIQGEKATVTIIRHLLQKYFRKDNLSDYIALENGIFGFYKTRFICKESNVYLGVQKSEVTDTQTRAIKFIPKSEKTLREAQILVKLGSHVNVVSIIHAGIYHADLGDYIYIAMEHSWTRTVRNLLEECIKLGKPFHEFNAWNLVKQLMKAVEFLHSHNIIHRDVKPDNVLGSDDWRFFKLTDFALSKEIKDGYATIQTNAHIGTEGYRSTETYDPNAKITAKTDIFSAGATIGEIMANGKHPFGEDPDLWKYNIKNNKNLDLSHLRVSYKVKVTYFIKRMLEMNPVKRPTAQDVLNDVSIYFQKFQLKNQQTTADESSETTSKAMTELSITEKVLTRTTADESLATTSKAIAKLSITETANAIIMFDEVDKRLYSYKPSTKKGSRMQEFPEHNSDDLFSTVVSGKHIYILQHQKVHQLEFSDPAADWKKMYESMKGYHGPYPPAAMLNGFIYVCGNNNASPSVERYDAALDRWAHMCNMNFGRNYPCVVATEDHIYCMGGHDDQLQPLQSVERYDERLNKWEIVELLPRPISIWASSAAVVNNRIYVADCEGVKCYDIQNNSWSEINLTIKWPVNEGVTVKILAVDEELYIIRPKREILMIAIYLLDPETKQMTLVQLIDSKGINPCTCIAVKL